MHVEIVTATKRPIDVISVSAGLCYGKDDLNPKRVERCVTSGHHSVLEHASVTFKISGISRSCSHQLVRHRLASYSQQSQRYCKIDTKSDDWYVVPEWFSNDDAKLSWFKQKMQDAAASYHECLESGCKPEDARFLLPEATKTEIIVTMNVRELFHFFGLRQGSGAQWEIKALAHEMEETLAEHGRQWAQLLSMRYV